jgi:DDE superfamily endonuclease
MEDVLDRSAEPSDPPRRLGCFDQTSTQVLAETRLPLPLEPGTPERVDSEYARQGTANLFLVTAPLGAWRHVDVTDHRTKPDFAQPLRDLVERHCPAAERIRVVLDTLTTHTPGALSEAFTPDAARRLLRQLAFHSPPVHGSWLHLAAVESSLLSRQGLGRRSGDRDTLGTEVAAWEAARNAQRASIHWHFTVDDARRKLHRLSPS